MSKGDVTKRDEIMWGYTLKEVDPYFKYLERDLLFREAVIGTLIDEKKTQEGIESVYCQACKVRNPDVDCSTCNKEITRAEEEPREKIIGKKRKPRH